jgi:hypothetical protein
LKCFWNHDLLLWKGEDDDHHEEKWDVLKIIELATGQNRMSESQLAPSN